MSTDGSLTTVSQDVGNISYATGTSYDTILFDLDKRLSLLESNVKLLPALIVEALLCAIQEFQYNLPPTFGIPVDDCGLTLRDQYGNEAKAQVSVDLQNVFSVLHTALDKELTSKVSYEELDRLRDRVRELEEDLGYRKAVAERLMEEPKGNRR